jgi:hypothetical protein
MLLNAISKFDGEAKKYENKKRGHIYAACKLNKGQFHNRDFRELIGSVKIDLETVCLPYEQTLLFSGRIEPA